ncbi:Cytokinin oxidase/dehydrogenase [Rhynchospora pubera]|uniref:cytokinin dehydrogenase n=1 Tax=Rhynchospora pubera TaxID=906938 RepID=A0AAV8DUC0_9POAL|nr:Cytokinin oxidase/dehydrogenase [Rhynchospora pubera]
MASPKQTLSFLHFTIILTTLTSFVLALVLPESLPSELQALDIFTELATDPVSMSSVATDFGNLSTSVPAAVFYPSSPKDIAKLIHFSYTSTKPFTVSPRGVGHSINGQMFAPDGIIVNMLSLGHGHYDSSTIVTEGPFPYADAGGEQHWIDVLNATLKHGLMPRIFTDYLYATVGGTLSNAGIGGQAFRQGPQISNVYELDVITGTGEIVTCSRDREPDLFYGALGGLGQFGVITRARIALEPAKKMARWVRLIYTDVKLFTSDQEKLISIEKSSSGFDYVEGQVILSEAQVPGIKSSFFSDSDIEKITRLAAQNQGPIYLLEGAAYYDDITATIVDGNVKSLLEQLNYESGFAFSWDVPLVDFLDRVHYEETVLRSLGLWLVPHPWLNLFVPQSKILDFDSRIFKGILKENKAAGLILIYPLNRRKWDDNMSVAIPTEEIFYAVSFLWSAVANDLDILQNENNQVLSICEDYKLRCKEYLPHYTNPADWQKHFGKKWSKFVARKQKFDPKALLSPGQQIFRQLQLS